MKLIIDIPDNDYRHIKEYYEKNDIVEATYSYIYYGIPLDNNATNWDVLKALFPQMSLTIDLNGQDVLATGNRRIDKDWWNEEYKKGEEDD